MTKLSLLAVLAFSFPTLAAAQGCHNANGVGRSCNTCISGLCAQNGCSMSEGKCQLRDEGAGQVSTAFGDAGATAKGVAPRAERTDTRTVVGPKTGPKLDPNLGPGGDRKPGDYRFEGKNAKDAFMDRNQRIDLPPVTNPNTDLINSLLAPRGDLSIAVNPGTVTNPLTNPVNTNLILTAPEAALEVNKTAAPVALPGSPTNITSLNDTLINLKGSPALNQDGPMNFQMPGR